MYFVNASDHERLHEVCSVVYMMMKMMTQARDVLVKNILDAEEFQGIPVIVRILCDIPR